MAYKMKLKNGDKGKVRVTKKTLKRGSIVKTTVTPNDTSGGTKRATGVTAMGRGSRSPKNFLRRGLRRISKSTVSRQLNTNKADARQDEINVYKEKMKKARTQNQREN